jgi:predicted transcriptional regulator
MRTTVKIDDDVLRAARHLAESKGQSLGQTLSELARASLTRSAVSAYRNGVRLFPVNTGAAGATLEEVTALRDALE